MAFNPLKEKGIPFEKQLRTYEQISSKPWSKDQVEPYTRCRAILMNGIEVEATFFSHQFARHTEDVEVRRRLAELRRVEQQQQKAVNWLIPGEESGLEVTIGFEQVAVDLTAFLARNEPDPHVKAALDFALLEDFDHLYRYANLMEITEGHRAEEITGRYTEIMPGRPTSKEHRHPIDEIRNPVVAAKADPRTILHLHTIVAAEQQTMNLYMNIGNRPVDPVARELYAEIAQVEEQHVTHYESLMDPNSTWLERLLFHEYTECWLYWSLAQDEPDPRIRRLWELHLEMEIEHLQVAAKLLRDVQGREADEILPKSMPEPFRFQSNVDYVRQILKDQTDWNAWETGYYPPNKLPGTERYQRYQKLVGADKAASEQVIETHRRQFGKEYRQELQGPHPLESMAAK